MKKHLIFIIALGVLTSCATYKKQVQFGINQTVEKGELLHSFYLIGDCGAIESDTNVLKSFTKEINNASRNATALFLGDNIYPKGLADEGNPSRQKQEQILNQQIQSVKDFKGKTIFIPGNHDWYNDGIKGLKRQENYIEGQLGKGFFQPQDGCPIKTVPIAEDIVLIIVDSQWYIANWNNHPTINDNCEIKTRSQFLDELRSEIKKARGKTTLIAMHHPMFSNGPHGGQYSFIDHLKPFPILGSLKNLIRKTSGISNADMSNMLYNELKRNCVAAAKQNEKIIFISGHEHSLQLIEKENTVQIISGSGSKTSATRNCDGGLFSYAKSGFAVLDVYTNGASSVRFVSAEKNTVEFQKMIFQKKIENSAVDYPILNSDSIAAPIYSYEETKKSRFHQFLWGERYRKYYNTSVKAKVTYLDTLFGGLKPYRKGGGTQSKALQLIAKDGKIYVMRAMKKQPAQYIQATLFKDQHIENLIKDTNFDAIVKDVFTGSFPYAPFTIPKLSEAINVAHLNPKLYYIPKQKALGDFNSEFGNELYLFEEHASKGYSNISESNCTGKIIGTSEVIEETHKNPTTDVDENEYIKARIFDMLIGDWDRHQDQWQWLEYKENGKTVYKPLPRDRDQSFSKMSDGFLLSSAMKFIPMAKLLRKYEPNLKDVKSFNLEPYPMDVALITKSEKKVWLEQAQFIQSKITDEVIDEAFLNVPKELMDSEIIEIKNTLKKRRSNLQEIAMRYYKVITKYAVLTGTNQDDYIKITVLKDGNLEVCLSSNLDHEIVNCYHKKGYNAKETKEIWIYSLDGNDRFEVNGKSSKIKIRLIGGLNQDRYQVSEGKNVFVYDFKSKKNDVSEATTSTLKLQDKYEINNYDYKKSKNNTNLIVPILGANPDDGFKFGLSTTYTTYGFERNPFTTQQKVSGAYYFATDGFEINYKGEFANLIGSFNFVLDAKFTSPNFNLNFFGFGNETKNFDDQFGLNFNRVRVRELSFSPSLVWLSKRGTKISLGMHYENMQVENTSHRYIGSTSEIPNYLFNQNQFFTVNSTIHFESYDNSVNPTVGIRTSVEVGNKTNLKDSKRNFTYLIPQVSFTDKLTNDGSLIFATQIKSHLIFNQDFEFYHAASIGGDDGLRGFRHQRFTGTKSLYQNSDIRYFFKPIKTKVIPMRLGLYSSFDYGKVFHNDQVSKKWNNSYGGGFLLTGAESITANLGVFHSIDGFRLTFNFGYNF